MKSLKDLIERLSPELQQEVMDFVEFLLNKRNKNKKKEGKPEFKWAGALKELSKQYTSVELQHKISEWRIGGE